MNTLFLLCFCFCLFWLLQRVALAFEVGGGLEKSRCKRAGGVINKSSEEILLLLRIYINHVF